MTQDSYSARDQLISSWKSIPLVSKILAILGVVMSMATIFFANFGGGLGAFFQREFGRDFSLAEQPSAILFLIFFVALSVAVSIGTSAHWGVFAWLSKYHRFHVLTGFFGIIMLILDGYLRISAVFFPGNSTSGIAVMFTPIVVGIPTLSAYAASFYLLGRFRRGTTNPRPPVP